MDNWEKRVEIIKELLEEVAERENCNAEHINWCSWPQSFPTTSGPRGGIGGSAITTFQVHGFIPPNGKYQKYCCGIWKHWNGVFEEKW